MKKVYILLIAIIFSVCLTISAIADENPTNTVCGKTFMLTLGQDMYLAVFPESVFGPSCGGTMTLYWSNQNRQYSFNTYENIFTNITGLGQFVLKDTNLIYMTPGALTLVEMNLP